jgi:hypothetical protein
MQLFGRASNSVARVTLAGLVLLVALVLWLLIAYQRSAWATSENIVIEQPIQFSHERHVAGNGIDCRFCHASVEQSSFAGFPPTQTCIGCHAQIFADAPYLAPVRASWRTGQPLMWRRVYDLPDHVYFNHRIHVAKGVGCATCHGRVDHMPLIRQATPLLMNWCLDCHRHPERYVRPREDVFSMTYQAPANQEELGRTLVAAYNIRPLVDCYTCHR